MLSPHIAARVLLSGILFLAPASSSTAQSLVQALPATTATGDRAASRNAGYSQYPQPTPRSSWESASRIEGDYEAPIGPDISFDPLPGPTEQWSWQMLPLGLMYRSYMADPLEPRFGSVWIHEADEDPFWDIALGGRAGILRYGTSDILWPQGCQLDIEGAAFPRLTLDHNRDLVAVDFRFGVPLTFRHGPWETKFGYYHLSSHLGDEYMLKNPQIERINYARDVLILGVGFRPCLSTRLYAETGWAFYTSGGAEPWEFRLGVEYSPAQPTNPRGAPFVAIGTHLREEVKFGGQLFVQTGWEWRGPTGRVFRCGLHYLNGKSNQNQFQDEHEEQIGFGTWFDF